jgi:hypothetical protein
MTPLGTFEFLYIVTSSEEEYPEEYYFEDPRYQFALEKGFLLISDKLKQQHLVNKSVIYLPVGHQCLGGE